VQTAGADADQHISRGRSAAIEDACALDGAHGEAREVVLAWLVEARHFRRLTTQQRAARELTAARDPANHGLARVHVEGAGGELRCAGLGAQPRVL